MEATHPPQNPGTRIGLMSAVPDKIVPPEGLTYGEPTWDIAELFPRQGCWSEQDYLDLDTNHLVEFSDGFVEFLPMPKLSHQLIAGLLYRLLEAFVSANGLGTVVGAPYKVRLWKGKYREPDVIFVRVEHASWLGEDFSEGADLVMEVVSGSESDRNRDLVKKREEYAKAGIPEYWIVDPELGQITVLVLDGAASAIHGVFSRGQQATSKLLPGFSVDVTAVLAAKR
jgi:Uma2 family endonuclease